MYKKILVTKNTVNLICSSYDSNLNSSLLNYYKIPSTLSQESITSFRNAISGNIRAEDVWNKFFPKVNATVFISHSGKDVSLAHKFANYLYEEFSIHSFIDYDLWGYFKNVLVQVYNDRISLEVCANLYAILAYSLTRMIDHCDLFCFLGTESSMQTVDVDTLVTNSPWIFHELTISNTIETRKPAYLGEEAFFTEETTEFPVILKDFFPMEAENFTEWKNSIKNDSLERLTLRKVLETGEQKSLQKLYELIDKESVEYE